MRPLTAVTLILLGSCVAITFSLTAVTIISIVLRGESPRLQDEFGALVSSLGIFMVMTALAAMSFYTLIRNHRLRYWAQAGMWLGILGVGLYYWP